jgi:hypothetical protein
MPIHSAPRPTVAVRAGGVIEPGKDFDIERASSTVRHALGSAPSMAQKLMAWKTPTLARFVNYWPMNPDTMAVYGNYYLKRAIVAKEGLDANMPEDAFYPVNRSMKLTSTCSISRRPICHRCILVGDALRSRVLSGC